MEDPSTIAKRIIEAYGGRELFLEKTEAQRQEYNSLWSRSAETMGRVLRAHLILEHFLTRYLQFRNPGLGDVDSARLSFSQKLDLVGKTDQFLQMMKPGIRHVNRIRNRFAHDLGGSVTVEDTNVFSSIKLYHSLTKAVDKHLGIESSVEPIVIFEEFCDFMARHLQQSSSLEGEHWARILGSVEPTNSRREEKE